MVLDSNITKKISDFVYHKPRTVQEISQLIHKNWRTADRYIEKIEQEQGTIATRTFRQGTRGALKVVFWNNIEKIHSGEFQEKLFKSIEAGKKKEDFSPFEIYQHIDEKKRDAVIEERKKEEQTDLKELENILKTAKEQLLLFSGNFSWVNLKIKDKKFIKILEQLARNKVQIKAVSRVDIASLKNLGEVLAINKKLGREAIEIRHVEQPLRSIIIDNKIARFKEVKNPDNYKSGELKKKMFIFYNIYDKDWIEWTEKIFWRFFRTGIPIEKRIKDLESIKNLI